MARLFIGEYTPVLHDSLHDVVGKSFNVPALDIDFTHAVQQGKGRTDVTATLALGSANLTIKASFPLSGRNTKSRLPASVLKQLTAGQQTVLGIMFESEYNLCCAANSHNGVNASFTVRDDNDRAGIIVRFRGELIYGQLTAAATLTLARCLSVGVATICQSEVDEIVRLVNEYFAAQSAVQQAA